MKFNLFLLFLVVTANIFAFAQDEDTEGTETTETKSDTNATAVEQEPIILTASPFITTAFIFPEYPTRKIIIGNAIDVIVGVTNTGDAPFNVTEISAALRYPQDWRYFIQNYTKQVYSTLIKPGEQQSFHYRFTPDPLLEPRDFGFSGQIFYHDLEGNNFTSYFYNTTIPLTESIQPLDLQTLFTYVGIVGIAGLVLFIIYKSVSEKKGRKTTRRVETGTVQSKEIDAEWLEGTHAVPTKSPKSQRSPSPKPKKDKST